MIRRKKLVSAPQVGNIGVLVLYTLRPAETQDVLERAQDVLSHAPESVFLAKDVTVSPAKIAFRLSPDRTDPSYRVQTLTNFFALDSNGELSILNEEWSSQGELMRSRTLIPDLSSYALVLTTLEDDKLSLTGEVLQVRDPQTFKRLHSLFSPVANA